MKKSEEVEMIREEKRAWWRAQVEPWQESHLSQSAYCRKHGLRLARSSAEEATLVPVHLVEGSKGSAADAGVVIELDDGMRVSLSRGFYASVLAEVVSALRAR